MTVVRLDEWTPGRMSAPVFADALSALASGVTLVTCRVDGRPWAMTVTAFASVSSEPPTVLVSLGSESIAARAIAETGSFGVALLAADQLALARFGSRPGASKFLEQADELARESLAYLDCELTDDVVVADHTLFIGRVLAARVAGGGAPLVYHRRDYRTVAELERSETCLAN